MRLPGSCVAVSPQGDLARGIEMGVGRERRHHIGRKEPSLAEEPLAS